MDIFERVYYMRAVTGVVAGIVAGIIISSVVPFGQATSYPPYLITMGLGIAFYIISFGIGKGIAKNVPKDKRRKVAMDGIIPFIFLLLTFMIIVYTALNQSNLK